MTNLEKFDEQIKKLQQQKRNAIKKAEDELRKKLIHKLFNNDLELIKKVIASENVEVIIDGQKIK